MAKQSMKQQIYQSIANSQVQQVMAQKREQEIAQLKASFDAWNKQQDEIANLQAQYDSWLKEQQPVQQATVNEVKTQKIPKLSERQEYVNKAVEERKRIAAQDKKNAEKEKAKEENKAIVSGISQKLQDSIIPQKKEEPKKNSLEDYQRQQQNENMLASAKTSKADKWLSPDYKLSDADKKEARAYVQSELKKLDYDSNKKPILKTAEDRQHYADMVNLLNKTNAFTNAMTGVIKQPAALGRTVRDAGNSIIDQLTGLGAAIGDKTGITEGATKRHNEKVAAREAFNKQNDESMIRALEGAKTQNPGATTAGEIGGQIGMYALTNPLFDSLGAAAGLGKAGSFALNQVGQNAQDLALDTIPMLNNYLEGGVSDEERKELLKNVGINALGNLVMGAAGEGISALAKNRAAKKAANEAFRANALEGADKLARLANLEDVDNVVRNATKQANDAAQNIENISKQIPKLPEDDIKLSDAEINNLLAKMEPARPSDEELKGLIETVNPENEIKALNDEMSNMWAGPKNAAEVIEDAAKVEPLLTPEIEDKLFYDFSNIHDSYYGNRQKIENMLANKDFSIPDAAINTFEDKDGKTVYQLVHGNTQKPIKNFRSLKAAEKAQAEYIEGTALKEKAQKAFSDISNAIHRYENAAFQAEDVEEVNTAKKAVEAARKRYERAMKEYDPEYYDAVSSKDFADRITQPYYTRNPKAENPVDEALIDEIVNDWVKQDMENPNRFVENVSKRSSVPGADPLQTFAENKNGDDWKISKAYKTFERMGYGDTLKEKDFAYRVFHADEQRALAAERYKDSKNLANDLLNRDYDEFDEADIKAIYPEMEALHNKGDRASLRMMDRLATKTAAVERESGRILQAKQEFVNTIGAALQDAHKAQDDLILEPWKSNNVKKKEGNSRIAKALADMGNKWRSSKVKPELTHEQIKKGVKAEIEREMGSVEGILNDDDLEFLTIMAEDKSIPVWQITDEIEHRLNTGKWYTLDEAIEPPKKLNTKLNNALKSLIETDAVRPEAVKPDLKQITEEVRNTLGKESADFEGLFSDSDIDYLANMINNGASKEELAEALNMKMATGNFGISDETLQEVNDIFKRISRFDPDSKQFVEGQAEAYRLLANEILPNATALEKFEAWRYIAMLGNPKTMIRNFVGNEMFGAVTGISNNLAALGEAGVDKAVKAMGGEGIQRTKSVLNPVKDMPLIKAAAEDADASSYRQIMGSKYEKFSKDSFRQYKSVFNSKLAQLYEKVTDAGISDYKAVKKKYSTSLAGYLKANGYDSNIFKAEDEMQRLKNLRETRLLSDAENVKLDNLSKEVEALEKGREYALRQAEYATFHEDNAFAKWLSKTSADAPKPIKAMIEGVVPFKKTPANVLKSGLQYSPLGAVDSLKKTGKLIYENTGKRAGNLAETYINSKGKEVAKTLANDVIESWARTLTGTGLTALGFYLYDKGALLDSDKETKYQDQLEGLQNYSIKIGDKTYTVDWAAPAVMPLLLGAEIAKVWNSQGNEVENWYENLDEYLNAANRIADPIIETSMLSGVKDTLETAANAAKYDENLNIPTLIGYNTLTGYLTQAIPTISGQIARTVDNTRRSAYTDKEGVAGTLEKQGRKLMNKIPGLTTFNQPYVDTYGREQRNSPSDNPAFNLAYQMISPGYLTDINTTEADKISREVFEKSGKSENVLPQWKSTFKFDGKRVSPEDYTKGAKVYGEAQKEIRDTLANDEWYNGLTPEEQTDIMNDINTLSEHAAKAAIDPEYATTSKPYTAYKEGGISGLMDYYKGQQAKNVAKESGLSSSSNASKAIQADVQSGNMEAAQEKIDAATYLQKNGLTKPGPSYTYYNAQDKIPSLTPEEFTKTYKAIDTNSNQGITQDELIAYLNKANVSESEGKKLWSAYGSSKWKAIPKLEGNTWKKGK